MQEMDGIAGQKGFLNYFSELLGRYTEMINLVSKRVGDIAKYGWEYHNVANEGRLYKYRFLPQPWILLLLNFLSSVEWLCQPDTSGMLYKSFSAQKKKDRHKDLITRQDAGMASYNRAPLPQGQ